MSIITTIETLKHSLRLQRESVILMSMINHISRGISGQVMGEYSRFNIIGQLTANDGSHRRILTSRFARSAALARYRIHDHFKSLVRFKLCLLIIFNLTAAHGQINDFNLPDFGDPSAAVISPIEEQRLGKKLMSQARRAFPYVTDPEIDAYIGNLGNKLVANSDLNQQKFHFYLIDRSDINAFAMPGGHISINTGLIANTKTESELAGVVAHEIVHVSQRHLPRMIARQKELSLPAAAAVIGGILLGGQAGAAAIVSSNAGLIGDRLSYTRDFEREADTFGMQILVKSGFDATGMPDFFNTLMQKTRLIDSTAPEFLRTHPLTINRISETENRARQYPPTNIISSDDYFYMREKVRALADNARPDRVAEEFNSRLQGANEELKPYVQYGYAYALMENKQYPEARKIAEQLRGHEPANPYLDNLLAQIESNAGNFNQAVDIMKTATERHPFSHSLKIDYADILLRSGNATAAERLLRDLIKDDRENTFLYRLYARANGEIGNAFESQKALGEYYQLRGEYRRALDHFHRAKNQAGESFYNQASIEAKIKEALQEKAIFDDSP